MHYIIMYPLHYITHCMHAEEYHVDSSTLYTTSIHAEQYHVDSSTSSLSMWLMV